MSLGKETAKAHAADFGPSTVVLLVSVLLLPLIAVYGWSAIGVSAFLLWVAILLRSYLLIVPNVPPSLQPDFYLPFYVTYWLGFRASLVSILLMLYAPKRISPENGENMIATLLRLILCALAQLAFSALLPHFSDVNTLSLVLMFCYILVDSGVWLFTGATTFFVVGEGLILGLALFPALQRAIPFATFAAAA